MSEWTNELTNKQTIAPAPISDFIFEKSAVEINQVWVPSFLPLPKPSPSQMEGSVVPAP